MHIIIDGYNLFKTLINNSYISKKESTRLIGLLVHYAHHKKHTIIIFFDSGPTFLKEFISSSVYVTICYAGQGTSADQAIIEYVSSYKNRPLLMVSNDNELKRSVALLGVESMKSLDFWYYVKHCTSKTSLHKIATPTYKHSLDENAELDALMEATSVPHPDESEQHMSSVSGLSKKEKKIALIIRKL